VLLGIGVTASLVSNRPKHGEHRCHIAAIAGTTCYLTSIVLEKGRRDRAQEEELVAQAIVYCVAEACGIDSPGVVTLIGGADRCIETSYPVHDWFNRLAHGEADRLTITPDGKVIAGAAIPRAVLAGSFDPLHEGHIELAHAAEQILGTPVAFEISIENVDKPPLAVEMVRSRVEQFAWRANVEVTRAATFLEKAKLLAGATFVVGADTAERIILPKYYGNSAANMKNALGTIASSGCSFLVAVREDQSGKVQSLDTVEVPADFAHLFKPIPEGHFRRDLSSTAIRSKTRH
jgi:hypothetical protein